MLYIYRTWQHATTTVKLPFPSPDTRPPPTLHPRHSRSAAAMPPRATTSRSSPPGSAASAGTRMTPRRWSSRPAVELTAGDERIWLGTQQSQGGGTRVPRRLLALWPRPGVAQLPQHQSHRRRPSSSRRCPNSRRGRIAHVTTTSS
jgi:hypothetical protein